MSVGQVTAVVKAHGKDGISGLAQRGVDSLVGTAAGVGLNVGGFGSEKLLDAFDGNGFDFINVDAAVVVTFAGIAFGVFVGENRALGGADGAAGKVFAGDQFDAVILSGGFPVDHGSQFGIGVADGGDVVIGAGFDLLQSAGMAGVAAVISGEPEFDKLFHFVQRKVVAAEDEAV